MNQSLFNSFLKCTCNPFVLNKFSNNRMYSSVNPYTILNIPKNSSATDIKKAYFKKAKENHTDKGGSEDKMKDINNAYEILKDKSKKEFFDRTGFTDEQEYAKHQAQNAHRSYAHNSYSAQNKQSTQSSYNYNYNYSNNYQDSYNDFKRYSEEMKTRRNARNKSRQDNQQNYYYQDKQGNQYNYYEWDPQHGFRQHGQQSHQSQHTYDHDYNADGSNKKQESQYNYQWSNNYYTNAEQEYEKQRGIFKLKLELLRDLCKGKYRWQEFKRKYNSVGDTSIINTLLVRTLYYFLMLYILWRLLTLPFRRRERIEDQQRKILEAEMVESQIKWSRNQNQEVRVQGLIPMVRNGRRYMYDPKDQMYYEVR